MKRAERTSTGRLIGRPVGEHAFLVEVGSQERVHALWWALRSSPPEGVEDVVAGARTVLVVVAPGASAPAVEETVASLVASAGQAGPGREVVIPVSYGGLDLAGVAAEVGISEEEVVRRHSSARYTVAFLGFSPGFAYIAGGDPSLAVPRLDTPRTAVPAGSVALASGMTAVYPQATPGGWRLIGRTSAVMFDPHRAEPAFLSPGDRVRFEPVPGDQVAGAFSAPPPAPDPAGVATGAYVEVLDPGPLTTVQDGGRIGWAHAGVPRAGALDRSSAVQANRLVGNPPGAALLESTLTGPEIRVGAACLVAVTGARAPVTVDGLPARQDVALSLPPGAELAVGAALRGHGARVYLAFSGGGVAGPVVLGSRSTDTLSGLGPEPLRAGQRVPLFWDLGGRPDQAETVSGPVGAPPGPLPPADRPIEVQARWGPREDWATPEGLEALRSGRFVVQASSDRTGIRLAGPPVGLARPDQLPSEGVVAGAVEIPPDGRPIVLLRNHPVTGGYPVVAVVDDAGVDRLAQARPGDVVRFRLG